MSTTNRVNMMVDKSKVRNGLRSDYIGWKVPYKHAIRMIRSLAMTNMIQSTKKQQEARVGVFKIPRAVTQLMDNKMNQATANQIFAKMSDAANAVTSQSRTAEQAFFFPPEDSQRMEEEEEEEDDDDDEDMYEDAIDTETKTDAGACAAAAAAAI